MSIRIAILIAIIVVGLFVRLLLAPYSSGSDIVQFAGFAKSFHRHSFCFYTYAASYSYEDWPFNWPYLYGPILIYILGALGYIVQPLYNASWYGDSYSVYVSTHWIFAVKLIYIVFDVIAVIAIFLVTRSIVASILFYLNPATIYVSSVYGMFDQMVIGVSVAALYKLNRGRYWLSGLLLGIALMIKQTALFPIIGIGAVLLLRDRRGLSKLATGFVAGILLSLAPILLSCPSSLFGILNTLYMVKPRYAEPLMYSFNGVTSTATLIHKFSGCGEFCTYNTLWAIEHWYVFTLILLPFIALSIASTHSLYKIFTLCYLLFTATYWGINYQYLVPEIAFIAIASVEERDKWLKFLYIVTAIYIAIWTFLYPVEWWFRAHIQHPNVALTDFIRGLSLNIYCDYIYAFYSLFLTQLHYAIILRASIHAIDRLEELKPQIAKLFKIRSRS